VKLFVLSEGSRATPASRIRVYEVFELLESSGGHDTTIVSYTSDSYCRSVMDGQRIGAFRNLLEKIYHLYAVGRLLAGAVVCDLVWIQRVLLPAPLRMILHLLNRRVVYDFDDAVYCYSPRYEKLFRRQVAAAASVVAVSSIAALRAVASGAAENAVSVVYTPVDCARFQPLDKQDGEFFTVGWIGSLSTSHYLKAIWHELAALAAHHNNIRFVFIGCPPFDTGSVADQVRFLDWSPEAEQRELPLLDVGLMPLVDTEWERGKGGFKLIQYMAAGVPTVSSPVGANLEIVVDGETGLFASDTGEWQSKLERLLADRELRHCMGKAGRARAVKMFDHSVAFAKYGEILARVKES
jgi:glycosyltransferase involved in cell wall biosynthesis